MIRGLEWFGTCFYMPWRTLWVTDSSDSKTRFTVVSDSYKLESVKGIEYPITTAAVMRKFTTEVQRLAL